MDLTPEQLDSLASAVAAKVQGSVMDTVNTSLNGLARRIEAETSSKLQQLAQQPAKTSADTILTFAKLAVGTTAPATVVDILTAKFGTDEGYEAKAKEYMASDEAQRLFAQTSTQTAAVTTTPVGTASDSGKADPLAAWLGL